MPAKHLLVLAAFATIVLPATAQEAKIGTADGAALPLLAAAQGLPVTVNRAKQYDFVSRINGLTYRVLVSTPAGATADKTYPVFYVLDGNYYFTAVSDSADYARLPTIVVGIGYPTDNFDVVRRRRSLDLTPSVDLQPESGAAPTGGGEGFLRVLVEEIKPFVAANYRTDPEKQILYGKSLGGLMVLHQLFINPIAFNTYIAASPSIWWNDREVLKNEAAFAKRAGAGDLNLRLLVTSAGDEQYRGDDPAKLAADTSRMIDNASELAARLAKIDPKKVPVTYTLFPNETHISVSLATLSRAIQFSLKP